LTEELVRTYGRKIKNLNLQPASGGLFEVTFNGELIFSKKKRDRFPEKGEIVGLIDQRR
jgi:selenoprotein W-related protein